MLPPNGNYVREGVATVFQPVVARNLTRSGSYASATLLRGSVRKSGEVAVRFVSLLLVLFFSCFAVGG